MHQTLKAHGHTQLFKCLRTRQFRHDLPLLTAAIGGAIVLSPLFHMPLLAGMIVAAAATCCILMFEGFGFRPLELNCSLLLISQAFDLPQGLVMVSERC
jgi:hypothetical protein